MLIVIIWWHLPLPSFRAPARPALSSFRFYIMRKYLIVGMKTPSCLIAAIEIREYLRIWICACEHSHVAVAIIFGNRQTNFSNRSCRWPGLVLGEKASAYSTYVFKSKSIRMHIRQIKPISRLFFLNQFSHGLLGGRICMYVSYNKPKSTYTTGAVAAVGALLCSLAGGRSGGKGASEGKRPTRCCLYTYSMQNRIVAAFDSLFSRPTDGNRRFSHIQTMYVFTIVS